MWLHSMTKDEFLQRWRGATGKEPKGSGQQYKGICPAHDDKEASLSVRFENGKILLHCHAGCDTAAVIEAMGLKTGDLFEKPQNSEVQTAVYPYYDSNGHLIAEKVRKPGKKFTWRRSDGVGGYQYGLGGVQVPLYNLPAIKDSDYVFLVEGEKDVETLKRLCQPAVSGANGAAKWEDHYTQALQGKKVMIIPDNDQPGRAYAVKAATALRGTAKSIHIMNLAEIWPEIPEKADITDYINAKGQAGVTELMNYFDQVPEYISGHEVVTVDGGQNSQTLPGKMLTIDGVEEGEPEWLVDGYVPRYQITALGGTGGSGKTTVECELVAAVSSGKRSFLLQGMDFYEVHEPGKVFFFSAEDSFEYTLRRRLRKNGANLKNVLTIDIADDRFKDVKFNSPFLEQLLSEHRPILCVFDPIQAFIPPDIRMGERNAMRACLAPLIGYGEKYGTTFLIVVHTNKQSHVSGRQRLADSSDIWDICRSVLMIGETDENNIRYLSQEKSNYGELSETVLFALDNEVVNFHGRTSKKDYDFIMDKDNRRASPAKDEARAAILDYLREGQKEVRDLDSFMKALGISANALKSAKAELKQEGLIKYGHSATGQGSGVKHYVELDGLAS